MALDSKITIVYGLRSVGGTSDLYQIDGPYSLDKSFDHFRLTFNVVVVATGHDALFAAADALEDDFRKRDQSLTITIDTSTWTYTEGVDLLNVVSTLSKTGDPETDRGYSRGYTVVIEGVLPADDASPETGLRDIGFVVNFEPGRQRVLTMSGVYTATTTEPSAEANYTSTTGGDAEAITFLAAYAGATFELVDEQYEYDRLNAICQFSRQYSELLANQSESSLDDTEIRDHRLTFTDLSTHPGDSQSGVIRMRRVVGTYDCAIDIEQTTDMQTVFVSKVEPHIKALFEANFEPTVFAVENKRVSYDETTKRLSVSIQFLYQVTDGTDVVEVSESMAYRERRELDYTPLHSQDELASIIDVGWAMVERISSRTVVVVGAMNPKRRIGAQESVGVAGPIRKAGGGEDSGPGVKKSGWNLISSTSQTTDQWMGDPAETQIRMTVLVETVVERFNTLPSRGR